MDKSLYFSHFNNVAIAVSGGVDSSVLLFLAKKYIKNVTAYYIKSQFQPQFELDDAKKICSQFGVPLKIIDVDVFSDNKIISNPSNRCYYCKTKIFNSIINQSKKDGCEFIFEGTNISDDIVERAGYKALKELKIISPFIDCKITKSEIRQIAKDNNIFVYNKPSYACLATRIPTDIKITQANLDKVNSCEGILFDMGYSDFRVRYRHDTALVQLKQNQTNKFISQQKEIAEKFSPYFSKIILDKKVR